MARARTEQETLKLISERFEGKAVFVRWGTPGKFGSFDYVWLRCLEDGNQWKVTISGIKQGSGCRMCAARRNSYSEADQLGMIADKLGGKAEFMRWDKPGKWTNTSGVWLRCLADGLEWKTRVGSIRSGYGCPQCGQLRVAAAFRKPELESLKIISEKLPNAEFVRWAIPGKWGSKDHAVIRCTSCDHTWEPTITNVSSGYGCPKCAGNIARTKEEVIELISRAHAGVYEFVRFQDPHRHSKEDFVWMRCATHDREWKVRVGAVIKGVGCQICAQEFVADLKRTPENDVLDDIANKHPTLLFKGWAGGKYRNNTSRAVMFCLVDGTEWDTTVTNLLSRGCGCPTCANYGYRQGKPGTLYALRSADGLFIKVGISNNFRQRKTQLERGTPFEFNVVATYDNENGGVISRLEKQIHRGFESAGLTGFDGATEWLKSDHRILELMYGLRSDCAEMVIPV